MPIFWYITLTLLGFATFPLTYRLLPALADRGYALARVTGLLIWAYAFWMLASLGVAQNDLGGILTGLLVLLGLSAWAFFDGRPKTEGGGEPVTGHPSPITWLRDNWRYVALVEILFLMTFVFMAFVRSANPDITGTEKPMELAFINAILRSPTFPPNDPWLSGYSISYYHFGYIMTAMLAKLTGTPGSLAFNLMLALVFALGAIGAYGIVYNLLAAYAIRNTPRALEEDQSHTGLAFLGPLFLLFVSNIEGFLEILHQRGLFWGSPSNFWTWLNIKELNQAPAVIGWIPDRFWWWWRASRVVQDYDLVGNWREVIDEFPFFSFLLGDLHPHVLAIPFGMLAVGVALNLYLGREKPGIHLFDLPLHFRKADFFFAALVLGGMAFLNTWDILPYAALIVFAYVLGRVQAEGWTWNRLEDLFGFSLPLGLTAILLYLPFYLGFASQAGGPLPNLITPTRGAHLWVMFGTLLIPLFAWTFAQLRRQKANWRAALVLTLGLTLFLWLLSWLMAAAALRLRPDVALSEMTSQGAVDFLTYFREASLRRLSYLGGTLTLLGLLTPVVALLTAQPKSEETEPSDTVTRPPTSVFALLLILLGGLLVLGPDFVYLRDQFGTRMNTVFKFYYQAWMLWSLAAAFGAAALFRSLRGLADWAWTITLIGILAIGLAYPVMALPNKTNNFNPPDGLTLDGAAYLDRYNPDDAAAIRFLQTQPLGVVAEAIGGSYTTYGRISTHTGLPTVLNWPGHEGQWRGGYEEQGTRSADIELLYSAPDWDTANAIIQRYNIRYIVVGSMERTTYRVNEEKFLRFLEVAFQQGDTTLYLVP